MLKLRNAKSKLRLEALERRLMMAGNVTVGVSGGNLFITGDGLNNAIFISGTATAGQYLITGAVDTTTGDSFDAPVGTATTINGQAQFFVNGVNGDININLNAGNDEVDIDNTVVPRNLNYTDSQGANDLEMGANSVLINGDVNISAVSAGRQIIREGGVFTVGNHNITTGGGNDFVQLVPSPGFNQMPTTGRNETISTGNNNDVVSVGSLFVAGAMNVDGGAGLDLLSIVNTTVRGSATFTGGDGADRIALDHVNVGGKFTVDGGAGDDNITFVIGTVTGETVVLGGGGNDTINVAGLNGRKVTIDAGGENDGVVFTASRADSLFAILGGGNDNLTISTSQVLGKATLDGGSGTNTYFDGGGNTFGSIQRTNI